MHFDFIYAQKESFAHRYGFSEICGCVPLDLGCFGPVDRSRRALTSGARRSAVSEVVCLPAGQLVAGPLVAGLPVAGLLVAGLRGMAAVFLFASAGALVFYAPTSPGGPALTPGGLRGR